MNLIIRIKINLLEPAHRHTGIHYDNGDPYWCFYTMWRHRQCSTMIKYKDTYKQCLIMLYPQYYREMMHTYKI